MYVLELYCTLRRCATLRLLLEESLCFLFSECAEGLTFTSKSLSMTAIDKALEKDNVDP